MSNKDSESAGGSFLTLVVVLLWYMCLTWFAIEVILPWIVRVIKVTWEGA